MLTRKDVHELLEAIIRISVDGEIETAARLMVVGRSESDRGALVTALIHRKRVLENVPNQTKKVVSRINTLNQVLQRASEISNTTPIQSTQPTKPEKPKKIKGPKPNKARKNHPVEHLAVRAISKEEQLFRAQEQARKLERAKHPFVHDDPNADCRYRNLKPECDNSKNCSFCANSGTAYFVRSDD